jgi:hypothetical protein
MVVSILVLYGLAFFVWRATRRPCPIDYKEGEIVE